MKKLLHRVNEHINLCWESFSNKVGNGVIDINKEASMQLQFAYILKNSVELILYHNDEQIKIELEAGIPVKDKLRECDLQVHIIKGNDKCIIPIEMKCYKTFSASGGRRGAQDLFRYGIYEDLELLESYVDLYKNRILGIELAMTDSRNFVFPKSKEGKSWDYDISDGTIINNGIKLNTPIGGKEKSLVLKYDYKFMWKQVNNYYFLKINGHKH